LQPLPPLPPLQRRGWSKNQTTAGVHARTARHASPWLTRNRLAAAAIAIAAALLLFTTRESMTPVRAALAGRLGACRESPGWCVLSEARARAQRGRSSQSFRMATCSCAARMATRTMHAVRCVAALHACRLRDSRRAAFECADSDGNQLSIQDNGDLYVERLDSEGRLDTAYLVGNIRDVPDVRADILADKVEEEMMRAGR
jgi:hypothetical protein